MTFEPNVGQFGGELRRKFGGQFNRQLDADVAFIGRGAGMTLLLTRDGMDVEVADHSARRGYARADLVRIRVGWAADGQGVRGAAQSHVTRGAARGGNAKFAWHGERPLRTISNYFLGRDPRAWHTNVPHFERAVATSDSAQQVGLVVHGSRDGAEYDLSLPAGSDASRMRLRFSGANRVKVSDGDVILFAGDRQLRMAKPKIYDVLAGGIRKAVRGYYVMEADGSVGLHLGHHDPRATLVIDPSISVAYTTFLGGAGNETGGNVAIGASGKVYVAGTTTSSSTFPEAAAFGIGGAVGGSAFYIAKIDPTVTGANSLLYLTFLGGSGTQAGGLIAVDGAGDVAITGTTTSTDFPVTGSSQPTTGLTSGTGNDAIVSEVNPVGNQLNFSIFFGGSGRESTRGSGGIALDQSGDVYIASDTDVGPVDSSSPDLPVTAGALQTTWDGEESDGYVAVFTPPTQPGAALTLKYCSYLGTNAVGQLGVGGVAVDASGNAYIAGTATIASSGFPALNAFQSQYGGGTSDGFVMKIAPTGQGPGDLVYATLIGGSGMDEILGIALDPPSALPNGIPPHAYVTGATQSADFPVNGAIAPFQSQLSGNNLLGTARQNAFLAVIAQDPVSAMTSLSYSTYLGGTGSAANPGADTGLSVTIAGPSAVYIAGQTDSVDFPWHDNLQPFNGAYDAFLAMFNPTAKGATSLIYSTPLGGTSPPGGAASAAASGVAAVGAGQVYVTGETTAADFPTAITSAGSSNGFQQICASCQTASPTSDAFLVAVAESSAAGPSVYFNVGRDVFPLVTLGTRQAGTPIAVFNGGEQSLTISDIEISGPNAADFSAQTGACIGTAISPGPSVQCSLELTFSPSVGGPESAYLSISDNAPGSPQLLEVSGIGGAPHALISPPSLAFGNQPVKVPNVQTVTIENTGTEAMTLSSIGKPSTSAFSLQGGSCLLGAEGESIAAGGSCTLNVYFTPPTTGPFQDQLQISDNSDDQSGAEQTIALSGTGTPAALVVQIEPASMALAFGTVPVGTTSGSQTVTLTNQGSTALSVGSIAIQGANNADFAVVGALTTCPTAGGTVAIGATCSVAVQFAPQSAATAKSAALSFSDNAAGSPQTVALTGSANNPAVLQVSPASLTFAAQGEGSTSAAQTITLTNTGASPATVSGISIKGANASDFLEQTACSPVLSAGANCQVSISFAPATGAVAGPRTATVNVPGGTPNSVTISGTATVAAISFTTSLSFASQLVGTTGAPQPITITNSSSGANAGTLTVSQVTVTGTNKTDFTITANSCSGAGDSISAGKSCTVQVAFDPQEAATCGDDPGRSATLQLQDNAPGSPQLIPLTGPAADFCLAAANGQPVTAPVTAGQPAIFNLDVASSGGFAGTVQISCSEQTGVDLGTCSVSPASVQASSSGVASFTVTVPTYAASSTSVLDPRGGPLSGADGKFAEERCVVAICLLLFIAAGGAGAIFSPRASGNLLRIATAVQIAALVLAFSVGIAACGGGGGDPSSNVSTPGTPPGNYTVTLTAASTSGGTLVTKPPVSLSFNVE
ncbi:MAG TPA: choice-of-anchor D domain-containing protein [Candidatus Dormibacteraeota bacterium]|nr:choice-of-anchor D domain-containing protein [Candidatus Dormibacteraeota bacterium]